MKKSLLAQSFLLALGEAVYVGLVATLINNASKIFGDKPGPIGFVIFLLLFVLSAAVSGALILGKPAMLYFEDKKKEAVKLFAMTIGWMFAILVILLLASSTIWK